MYTWSLTLCEQLMNINKTELTPINLNKDTVNGIVPLYNIHWLIIDIRINIFLPNYTDTIFYFLKIKKTLELCNLRVMS